MSSFVKGARITRASKAAAATTPDGATVATTASAEDENVAPVAAPAATNVAHAVASAVTPVTPITPSLSRPHAAGTRAWLNGLTLSSSGVIAFDKLVGGGLPLGSLLLLKEDGSGASTPFLRSFVADGVHFKHRVMYIDEGSVSGMENWIRTLPRQRSGKEKESSNSSKDKDKDKEKKDDSDNKESGSGLKLAWRYEQYLNKPLDSAANLGSHKLTGSSSSSSSGKSSSSVTAGATLSSSYDYHTHVASEVLHANSPTLLSICDDILPLLSAHSSTEDEKSLFHDPELTCRLMYRHVFARISDFIDNIPAGNVGRILVQNLGGLGWRGDDLAADPHQPETYSRPLLLFLSILRQFVSNKPVLVMISLPSLLLPPAFMRAASHYSDAVYSLSAFAGGLARAAAAATLGDFDGILKLEKLPLLNTLVNSSAAALGAAASAASGSGASSTDSAANSANFLFKLSRYKIVIEKFALPPEAEEEAAAAGGSASDSFDAGFSSAFGSNEFGGNKNVAAANAPKVSSVRSAKPPSASSGMSCGSHHHHGHAHGASAGAAAAAPLSQARESQIAYENEISGAERMLAQPASNTSTVDPKKAEKRAKDDALKAILKGRSTGTSGEGVAHAHLKVDF